MSSPWLLTVVRSIRLTPNMQRITFGGDGLADFPAGSESAYLKISFPTSVRSPDGGLKRRIGRILGRKTRVVRSYTVRRFNAVTRELDIDFVIHSDTGHGSDWALHAAPGDVLYAGGPGPAKLLRQTEDWCLMVGDLSSLPAIAANLECLDETTAGIALIEVPDAADQQSLTAPSGLEIRWLVNPDPSRSADVVMAALRALEWRVGTCEAWVASELETVRQVRNWLRGERGLTREQMYASSYWQLGRSDEQHRVAKAADQQMAKAVG